MRLRWLVTYSILLTLLSAFIATLSLRESQQLADPQIQPPMNSVVIEELFSTAVGLFAVALALPTFLTLCCLRKLSPPVLQHILYIAALTLILLTLFFGLNNFLLAIHPHGWKAITTQPELYP